MTEGKYFSKGPPAMHLHNEKVANILSSENTDLNSHGL